MQSAMIDFIRLNTMDCVLPLVFEDISDFFAGPFQQQVGCNGMVILLLVLLFGLRGATG